MESEILNLEEPTRLELLVKWASSTLKVSSYNVSKLAGDASFRKYYLFNDFVIVDSPPDSQKNLEFLTINKLLAQVGIKVPEIINYDLKQGFFILENLGKTHFADVAKGKDQESFYIKAVNLLPLIAKIDVSKLEVFDESFITRELHICTEWLFEKFLHLSFTPDECSLISNTFSILTSYCDNISKIAMHRDFHCRNIMLSHDKLALIDYQDMVKGPFCYDLASLIFDCYVTLDGNLVNKLLHLSYNLYKDNRVISCNFNEFEKMTRLCAMQRHIKVLGLFIRLALRDKKEGYLKDLPRVLNYVLHTCSLYEEFNEFGKFLEKHCLEEFNKWK